MAQGECPNNDEDDNMTKKVRVEIGRSAREDIERGVDSDSVEEIVVFQYLDAGL